MKLVITLRQQGKLQQVVEILQQELQLANESGMAQTDVFGCILAIWGEILAEFHDLERAIDLARRGVDLAERGSDVGLIGWSYLCLMRVLFSRRDFSGVDEIYQKTEKINREVGMPPWITGQVVAWQTRKWLAQGKLDISSQWALEHGLSIDGELTYIRTTEYVVLARLLIAQERLGEASKLLARLFDAAKAGGRVARMIEIWILQALVFQARDDTENAIATIRKAVTLAEPESFVCIFVDEGPAMARLLYETLSHGIAPDYVRRLLAAFPVSEPEGTVPTKPQVDQSELIEPLSEREIEVLQLIAEGLTSREIAARLYLSPNTVKVHSRNINSKLGVNNRVKAVIKARTLGILPFT
jgi:LuxR family maltose regulon positive regulatory protein